MKRTTIILSLIFALAIALSVSVPTLAANPETTTITGTIQSSIDITTHPANFTLSGMVPEVDKESTAQTVVVKSNKAGWTLTVADLRSSPVLAGYMDDGSTRLTNPLRVKGGDQGSYAPLTSAVDLETNGAKYTAGAGQTINNIYFAQLADWEDNAAQTYTIIVTFTATNS